MSDTAQTILGLCFIALPFVGLLALSVALFALKIYGAVLAFRKKWYFGLMALVVPFFGEIVGGAKLLFKKDLLKG
jgi:hypothetical protein